jgi:hypothetical protein
MIEMELSIAWDASPSCCPVYCTVARNRATTNKFKRSTTRGHDFPFSVDLVLAAQHSTDGNGYMK